MDEKIENIPYQILVDKNQLKGEFERIIIECSNAVFIGLAAIDKLKEAPEFIMGENEFNLHKPFLIEMGLEDSQKYFKSWIIKKGFEDLIKAVTFLLIDVCKVLAKRKKLIEVNPKTLEDLQTILNSNEHNVSKEHYPSLIDKIKPYLTGDLAYIDEINSINRVRRCLVHRDGLVTPLDCQNGQDYLLLQWIYNEMMYEENGIQKPFALPFMILTANSSIILKEEKRKKMFHSNDKILIEYQLFNELIWTIFKFGEDLISKLTFNFNNKIN